MYQYPLTYYLKKTYHVLCQIIIITSSGRIFFCQLVHEKLYLKEMFMVWSAKRKNNSNKM